MFWGQGTSLNVPVVRSLCFKEFLMFLCFLLLRWYCKFVEARCSLTILCFNDFIFLFFFSDFYVTFSRLDVCSPTISFLTIFCRGDFVEARIVRPYVLMKCSIFYATLSRLDYCFNKWFDLVRPYVLIIFFSGGDFLIF